MSGDRPANPASHRRPHPGVVSDGSSCRSCGYELTGLDEHGVCPECGTPVALSLRGDDLINADPAWLKLLARGGTLALITACFGSGLGFLRLVLAAAAGGTPAPTATHIEALIVLLGLANSAAFLVGLWWVTTSRSDQEGRPEFGLALAARLVLITGLLAYSASQLAQLGTPALAPVIVEWGAVWVLMMGWTLLLYHFGAFAKGMGATKLTQFTDMVAASMGISGLLGGLVLLGPLMALSTAATAGTPSDPSLAFFACCGSLVMLIVWACSVYATYQVVDRLHAVSESALIARSYLPRTLHSHAFPAEGHDSRPVDSPEPSPDASAQ